jgi:hypothetical protein
MRKKIPNNAVPDPEQVLDILGIPVIGSIGDDDEKLGFKWKKKVTPSSGRTCRGKRGGDQSSGSTDARTS